MNKVDNHQRQLEANEFYSLGFDRTFFLSSITGSGTGELLDDIAELLEDQEEEKSELPRLAIVGQPNAGKSSLVNALLGEERDIVTEVAGTTRDSVDTHYNKFARVHHRGYRRDAQKAKVHEDLEFYSVMRAIKAIEECDMCAGDRRLAGRGISGPEHLPPGAEARSGGDPDE